jgi:plastocyanin
MHNRNWNAARCFALVTILALLACAAVAQTATVTGQVVVKHSNKKPRHSSENENVAVWLTPLDDGGTRPVTSRRHRMTQKDKQFHPHVLAVPVGTAVEFPNQDPWFHNVFSLYKGERFDLGLYEGGGQRTVRFERPGVSFIFCNIHPEMNAYVLALETPYFAISNARGQITIPEVAPGRYRLEIWYERAESAELARISKNVAVVAPDTALGTMEIQESSRMVPAHTDKHGRAYEVDRSPY